MKSALLLIDLQQDFLTRAPLIPPASQVLHKTAFLLGAFRDLDLPVFHIHTVMKADGTDIIPHWRRRNYAACLENSPGCLPPPALAPTHEESVFIKRFYNGFAEPGLEKELRNQQIDTLIVAGLYLHGCVRTTVFAAYELGFKIWIAADCVASFDPLHADISRTYLEERAAVFLDAEEILNRIDNTTFSGQPLQTPTTPVAVINNSNLLPSDLAVYSHFFPARSDTLADCIPLGNREVVTAGVSAASKAGDSKRTKNPAGRAAFLQTWADGLRKNAGKFAELMAKEIGKPVSDGLEEVHRAEAHVRTAARIFNKNPLRQLAGSPLAYIRNRPLGVVAIITPWNNPVAIPAAKIGAALAAGNGVVWKPALQSPRTSLALMDSLIDAGLEPGQVNCVLGGEETAQYLISNPAVAAVSLTGSLKTGRRAARLCTLFQKPLQAELGGNNGVIVMADCDLDPTVEGLIASAYGFAGQRCTASRRIIVDQRILKRFIDVFIPAVQALKPGAPLDPATRLGPLISPEKLAHVKNVIQRAVGYGARLLYGGTEVDGLENGNWLLPAVLTTNDAQSELVQEETFGPVAVIMAADDLGQALSLLNSVPHGLVASIHTTDPETQKRFLDSAQAGLLRINQGAFRLHPEAPFGGWKASAIGLPEHGLWDVHFYSKPQAIYGEVPGNGPFMV